jgi:hypothetical protein
MKSRKYRNKYRNKSKDKKNKRKITRKKMYGGLKPIGDILYNSASKGLSKTTNTMSSIKDKTLKTISNSASKASEGLGKAGTFIDSKLQNTMSGIESKTGKSALALGDFQKGIETGIGKGLTDAASSVSSARQKFGKAMDNVSVIKQITSSIAFVVGNILGLPFKHIDQIIPENVCKDLVSNPVLCNQNMKEFLFTGSKKDFGKLLDKKDIEEECLTLDDMNHVVKCKHKKKSLSSMLDAGMKGLQGLQGGLQGGLQSALETGIKGQGGLQTAEIGKEEEKKEEEQEEEKGKGQNGGSGTDKKKPKVFKQDCTEGETEGKKYVPIPGKRPLGPELNQAGQGGQGGQGGQEDQGSGNEPEEIKQKMFRREANLKNIRKHLIKANLLIRKYQCPKDKLKSILKKVKDKELLIKIKGILETLMDGIPPTQYTKSKNEDDSLKARKKCDDLYNTRFTEPTYKKKEYELKIIPDVTHITFSTDLFDLFTDTESCPICSPWDTLTEKYFELVNYSMMGDKKSIYILVNFLHDIIVAKKYEIPEQTDADEIFEDIRHILHNIQCRSDVIGILDELIAKMNTNIR